MSSQTHRVNQMLGASKQTARTDEIQLTDRFSEQMAQLCMNDDYSDVVFIVENERLSAHRVILAARSEYFRAMLFGGLSETNQHEIELKIPLDAFKALLKYIYSGHMLLSQMQEEQVLDTLGLAHQYGFTELEAAISEYLRHYLSLDNACAVLDAARLYSLNKLADVCLTFMDRNAECILKHASFKLLSKESLVELLQRDSFFAPEVQIFQAVSQWCTANKTTDIQSVLSYVRLPLMDLEDLLHVVRPSGILDPNKLLDALDQQTTAKNLPYRAALWPEVNVATEKFRSTVIRGDGAETLLDGDVTSYDMEKGYSRHYINVNENSCIMVELGTIFIINQIKLLLWDRDIRAYSYYLEVSVNGSNWERVIDYSQYLCRSWQTLYFTARPVRFIKLVGTHNTINKVFHVVALEAMFTKNMPNMIGDIIAPTANVASIVKSALVLDGVSRARNALINGDYTNYDWDTGYTCHQLGSGEIIVRLGQPYIIGSMRLLLWDCDNRTYSYSVETSTNKTDWDLVHDARNDHCRSWQNFAFPARPVIFIRIVGTRNSANEIFHCVHLECPSQDAVFLKQIKDKEKLEEKKKQMENMMKKEKLLDTTTLQEESNDKTTQNLQKEEQLVTNDPVLIDLDTE